ncbi:MAG: hypothetical protein QOI92_1469 [Chloroflexota bacterium]|nr:hypothetical protein [Chloroflexota bacterium]
MHRFQRSAVLAVLAALAIVGSVLAANPTGMPVGGTSTAIREYTAGTTLTWKYGGTYPAWAKTAITAAMGSDWSNLAFNNTRMPRFSYSASGLGTVVLSTSGTSPCGTGNTEWIQCSKNWGTTGFIIYIRDLVNGPHLNWAWYNTTGSCPSGKACWLVERALMHEIEHVTLGIANHDAQGESYTVMASTTPWSPNTGWNTKHIQKCDEAAGQLLYGLSDLTGVYGDCFASITGHGSGGLASTLTSTGSGQFLCNGQGAAVSGRLAIKVDTTNYKQVSGNPLAGRTIYFDRAVSGSGSWVLNFSSTTASAATGNNWSASFGGTNVSYDFRPHYGGEAGVAPVTGSVVTLHWSNAC